MSDLKLSEHFYLSEFTISQTASRLGRKIVVEKDDPIYTALRTLCVMVLEPVRSHFGPLVISSGFRPAWLNETLPSTANLSQHMKGEAADFTCPGHSVEDVTRWISENAIPYDQLIYEFGAWTHCSYSGRHKRQVLTAQNGPDGNTVYLQGIVV